MQQDQPVVVRRPLRYKPSKKLRRSLAGPKSIRRLVAACLAVVVTAASMAGLTYVAAAATPGIQANILLNGTTYNGVPVVDEGHTLTLRVQYSNDVAPGSTVAFELGSNVTVTDVPTANTAIESVTKNGNLVEIKFRDPWPPAVNQGVFDLDFTVNQVTKSSLETITWSIDGDPSSVDVIIRNTGDTFANVTNATAKAVSPANLDSYVSVNSAGVVTVNPTIANRDLDYTLSLDSDAARSGYAITDQLPSYLEYVTSSFAATITTWDANGLNQATDPFSFTPTVAGNSFTSSVDVPGAGSRNPAGPSKLRITYKARVAAAQVAALQSALQANYDDAANTGTTFQVDLINTATFDTTPKTATVRVRGTKAGANVGNAFAKTADWSTKNVVTDEAGNLMPPADITYTLKADLATWQSNNSGVTLDRNVVISDTLPTAASWNTGDAAFLTANGIALSPAPTCPTTVAAMADDAYLNTYCVSGQRLFVNVGKDNTTNASIDVKVKVNSITGLTQTGTTTIKDAVPYRLRNQAVYTHHNGAQYTAQRDTTVVVLPDDSEGLNDPSVFAKTGTPRDLRVNPGETVIVDYQFSVVAGKGIDARTSRIVDYVDPAIFDISDLTGVDISGTYDGVALDASHFALSTDASDNLVIELSAAGKAIVTAQGADKAYKVNIALETKPFDGKETKTIKNRATLFGEDNVPKYWSESSSEATSFGDEAEVRKRVFDNTAADWAENVDALMDGEGNLAQSVWVYRVQFIPHGSYNNVTIVPVLDNLPAAVEWVGFVDEADAATGANPVAGPMDIGGNLSASYDAGSRTMRIEQKPGTKLDATNSPFSAYFAVQVTDASDVIVNRIGTTAATITPVPSVSVGDFVWIDTNRDGRQDPGEPGIRDVVLTIVGPDGEPVTDVNGNSVGPVTTDADGKYTFDNLPALTGEGTYKVCIDRDASAEALTGYVPTKSGQGDREGDSSDWCAESAAGTLSNDGDRDPTLDFGFVTKTYAVGDYVWIDSNNNGVQDATETPLAGVKVELLNGTGEVLATTATDDNGRYVFDDLAAGTYQVRFTLTDAQKAKYKFTTQNSGSDMAVDSDADTTTGLTKTFVLDDSNEALSTEYEYQKINATQGIDPTWDAGVVLRDDVDTGAGGEGDNKPGDKPTDKPGDGAGVGAGNAGRNGNNAPDSKLAFTGINVMLFVSLATVMIMLGWAALQIGLYRRRES